MRCTLAIKSIKSEKAQYQQSPKNILNNSWLPTFSKCISVKLCNEISSDVFCSAHISMMDRLTATAGFLFFVADVCAIISVYTPDWIVSDVGGETKIGLMWTCITLYNRSQICFSPDLQPEWLLTLVFVFLGCICIATTIILLGSAHWDPNVIPYARWVGFTAMVLFCMAAVIFPMGFHVDEIGGQPYQLPNSHEVGLSYILFILSLWLTVISELIATKVCLPHF